MILTQNNNFCVYVAVTGYGAAPIRFIPVAAPFDARDLLPVQDEPGAARAGQQVRRGRVER